ncbi:hypothetical protein DRZ78_00075 [Candidatus Aerophobetes bacterium]|uniref:Uncharacterized protein n=1 Tax=Aerophobetes bacterium TaxID=2030807 RepID=A0A662D2F3_UNCAE|nr:MAG: hypothetical protein DRZ78_00075 [Candidatus Aerophobetes bacterium]
MKINGNLKVITEKVKEDGEIYSIGIYGEEIRGEERVFTMNLNLNNISKSELKKIEKKLKVADLREATRASFPVTVEISIPQKRLDDVIGK